MVSYGLVMGSLRSFGWMRFRLFVKYALPSFLFPVPTSPDAKHPALPHFPFSISHSPDAPHQALPHLPFTIHHSPDAEHQ